MAVTTIEGVQHLLVNTQPGEDGKIRSLCGIPDLPLVVNEDPYCYVCSVEYLVLQEKYIHSLKARLQGIRDLTNPRALVEAYGDNHTYSILAVHFDGPPVPGYVMPEVRKRFEEQD